MSGVRLVLLSAVAALVVWLLLAMPSPPPAPATHDRGAAATNVGHVLLGDEARPAALVTPARPLTWRAAESGPVRFAIGAPPVKQKDAVPRPATGIRVFAEPAGEGGARRLVLDAGAPEAGAWQSLGLPGGVVAGERLAFVAVAPPGETAGVLVADPRVERAWDGEAAPLVIILMLDTLRADHTSLYGYELPTTPHLEALAEDAVVFERAYSPSNWTRPAVASLLTGLDPDGHRTIMRNDRLRDRLETLPEIARAGGLQTVGISTNPNVLPVWGFAQGFGRFVDLETSDWFANSDARDVLDRTVRILAEEGLPLLLYLHLNDVHNPYAPPLEAAQALYPDYTADTPGRNPLPGADPATLRGAMRRYDGEIRHMDGVIGELFAHLEDLALYDRATIVVVADHGEEFGEHGGIYHGATLYEETIRVPLLIKLPDNRWGGTRVDGVVSAVDVMPTIADVLGWLVPDGIDGRSLIGLIDGSSAPRRGVYSFHTGRGRHRTSKSYALTTGGAKLIHDVLPTERDRLFDLVADPGELVPRTGDGRFPELMRGLTNRLAARSGGWHARLCGGDALQRITLTARGLDASPQGFDLEPDDTLSAVPDGWRASLVAAVGRPARGGARRRTPRSDDEIVFRGRAPELEVAVAEHDAPVRIQLDGDGTPSAPARHHRLTLRSKTKRGALLAAPSCPPLEEAVVLVWHVDEASGRETVEPDASVIERLRALGYVDE